MSTATTDTRKRPRTGTPPRSPLGLTWAEWLDVFKRAGKRFLADDCMGLSQQVAFSALLAFLPTVILLIGLLGLFGAGAFNSLEHFVGSVAPHGVVSMIDLAKKDAAQNKSASAIAFAVGVIVALWAASGAMGAIVKAVNRAYKRLETRPFWKVRLISLVLVVATGFVLAGTFLLIIFGGSLGDAIARRTPLDGGFKVFWNIARWPVAFIAVLLFLELIYYLAPNRESRTSRWLTPASPVWRCGSTDPGRCAGRCRRSTACTAAGSCWARRTSTTTPTDSSPGFCNSFRRWPAASSSSAMHLVVAKTAGKLSPVIGFSAAAVSASVTM